MNMARFTIAVTVMVLTVASGALASMSPATWITQRVLGVLPEGVVLLHLKRHVASYYKYDARQELRVVSDRGCIVARVTLQDTSGLDTDAEGHWETKSLPGDTKGGAELLARMAPVVTGSPDSVVMRDGGLWIGHDGDWHRIVTAQRIGQWAALVRGQDMTDGSEELSISGIWQSVHALQDRGLTYVELAPAGTEIDVDRTAFVVPVDDRAARKLLESGQSDEGVLAASQPEPAGC